MHPCLLKNKTLLYLFCAYSRIRHCCTFFAKKRHCCISPHESSLCCIVILSLDCLASPHSPAGDHASPSGHLSSGGRTDQERPPPLFCIMLFGFLFIGILWFWSQWFSLFVLLGFQTWILPVWISSMGLSLRLRYDNFLLYGSFLLSGWCFEFLADCLLQSI